MRFTLRFVLVLPLLLLGPWTGSIRAAEKAARSSSYQAALESIRADALAGHVGHLADPAMEGREAGTPGGRAAAKYLADRYAKLTLQPAGADPDNKYFQSFEPNYRNVLALLAGSDPTLRRQVILVGAHYDHIGYGGRGYSIGPYGYIYPGADDNASGTSAVLALARALTLLSPPPKRSILLAHWDAEEKGLLGSKHWAAHPTVTIDRVAAVLNLDMVGRLRNEHLFLIGSRTGYGWRRLLAGQNDGGLKLEFLWGIRPNADYYPLCDHGIPALMFYTGMHNDYHRPSDVPKSINVEGMMTVTRLLFAVVYELADRPAPPAFRAAARHETPTTEQAILQEAAPPAERLGVGWTEDAAVAGGVVVASVAPGSPAEHSGLRPGDRIVRFAGRTIAGDDDFFGAVAAAENPAAIAVQRPGEPKPLDLTATLAGHPLRWGLLWRVDDAEPGVVIVTHVVRGSPAAQAGLRAGDRIYQVLGRDFADEAEFARLAAARRDALPLLIERDGRLRTVTVYSRQAAPMRRAA
jgi:hypothetical protein